MKALRPAACIFTQGNRDIEIDTGGDAGLGRDNRAALYLIDKTLRELGDDDSKISCSTEYEERRSVVASSFSPADMTKAWGISVVTLHDPPPSDPLRFPDAHPRRVPPARRG